MQVLSGRSLTWRSTSWKMEVSLWRNMPLPRNLRRLLVFSFSAAALLGLLGLTGWRLLRGTRRRRTSRSPAPENTTEFMEAHGSPAGSEDSGVVDTGSQEGGSRKTSQENLHTVQRVTTKLTYHSGIKEFVPQQQIHLQSAAQQQRSAAGTPQQDSEAPLREEESHRVNSKGWAYPTASSDLQSETFSDIESISSSEGLLSMPPRSPVHIESSAVPSPSTSGPTFPVTKHKGSELQASSSTSCLECGSADTQPCGVAASRSTPVVTKPDRVRVVLQLPKDLVGRFIGKQGRNIKALMADSNGSHVYVNQKNLPKDALIVPCTVQGTAEQVEQALQIIDSKYPEVEVPLRATSRTEASCQLTKQSPSLPFSSLQLEKESWDTELLPAVIPSSPFKAMVSYIESLDRVWLVDYHNSSKLDEQHQSMSYSYCCTVVMQKDSLPTGDTDKSIVSKFCAVRVSDIHWLRGKVIRFSDDEVNFEVQLMDYGSTVIVPSSAIRPLRKEYSQLPIQAFPCIVANIVPKNVMSEEGLLALQSLLEGMMIEVHITGWAATADDSSTLTVAQLEASQTGEGEELPVTKSSLPMVELYTQFGSQTPTFINRELVERGYAMWCEGEGEGDKPSASGERCGGDDEELVEEKERGHEQ